MLVLVPLCGCAYTVQLLSDPQGAIVHLPDHTRVTTPAEATFRWRRPQRLLVTAPGYRDLSVDMHRTEGRVLRMMGAVLFQKGPRQVTFHLTEEHPPPGAEPP